MFRKIDKKEVISSLKRYKGISKEFIRKVSLLPQKILENLGNELALKAVKMSRDVDADLHAHKAFMRFQVSPNGILYASTNKMKHNNERALIRFFKERFPTFVILFESSRGVYAGLDENTIVHAKFSLSEALGEFENKLPIDPVLEELSEGDYEELWKHFAHSQLIQSRKELPSIINLDKRWNHQVTRKAPKRTLEQFLQSEF